jgi:hypothetical protein
MSPPPSAMATSYKTSSLQVTPSIHDVPSIGATRPVSTGACLCHDHLTRVMSSGLAYCSSSKRSKGSSRELDVHSLACRGCTTSPNPMIPVPRLMSLRAVQLHVRDDCIDYTQEEIENGLRRSLCCTMCKWKRQGNGVRGQ